MQISRFNQSPEAVFLPLHRPGRPAHHSLPSICCRASCSLHHMPALISPHALTGQPPVRRLKLSMPSLDRQPAEGQGSEPPLSYSAREEGSSTPRRPSFSPVTPTISHASLVSGDHAARPAPDWIDEPEPLPLSLEDNADAIALRAAISILQLQRQQSLRDIKALDKMKAAALRDPETFLDDLKAGKLTKPDPVGIINMDDSDDDTADDTKAHEGVENAFNASVFSTANDTQLGELQASYQTFSQEYLLYRSSVENGFYVQKRVYLQKDLVDLNKQESQLNAQKALQKQDLSLADDEYRMHKKLVDGKVETTAELRQEESKYLAKKSPLIQTDAALVSASTNYSAKQKEILELDNQIAEERSKFVQALNSLISQAEDWQSKYVLTASQPGKVTYAGIVQENQVLAPNQEVFYINPGNEQFFGEMSIPQDNLGKVKEGQEVLIKLKSYPFEEYGMLKGKIAYISDVPYKDSIFVSRVEFRIRKTSDMKRPIHLKQGMMADAEIVTQDATILQRITRNMVKLVNSK